MKTFSMFSVSPPDVDHFFRRDGGHELAVRRDGDFKGLGRLGNGHAKGLLLAGIRVEVPWVFEEAHAEVARWFREGLADGLRIDHPDGLADPSGYLARLKETTGGSYVLVEKILTRDESLPDGWPVSGTTGYEFANACNDLFVDGGGWAVSASR